MKKIKIWNESTLSYFAVLFWSILMSLDKLMWPLGRDTSNIGRQLLCLVTKTEEVKTIPTGLSRSVRGKCWKQDLVGRGVRGLGQVLFKKSALSKASVTFLPTGNLCWSQLINRTGEPSWPWLLPFEVWCPLQHEEIICCLIQWAISRASRPNDMWEY